MGELEDLRAENERLKKELERVSAQNEANWELTKVLRRRIREALNPREVKKISFRRLELNAREIQLTVVRDKSKIRLFWGLPKWFITFKSIKDAWEFVMKGDYLISDFTNPPKPKPKKTKPQTKPCKYCQQLIYWKWDGRSLPYNADSNDRHYCNAYRQRRTSFHDRIKQGGGAMVPF